jgi:hypothetical protein
MAIVLSIGSMDRLVSAVVLGAVALCASACGSTEKDEPLESDAGIASDASDVVDSGIDSATCKPANGYCTGDGECCSGTCAEEMGVCLNSGVCLSNGTVCVEPAQCCTGRCFQGKCEAPCIQTGNPCGPGGCCGTCTLNVCS